MNYLEIKKMLQRQKTQTTFTKYVRENENEKKKQQLTTASAPKMVCNCLKRASLYALLYAKQNQKIFLLSRTLFFQIIVFKHLM